MYSAKKKFDFSVKSEELEQTPAAPNNLKFHNLKEADAFRVQESSAPKVAEIKEFKKKKFKSKNYFGVKNHIDLFEIGKYYSNLMDDGMKSFAFYGSGGNKSAHHSILGIASYFNYHKNLKATVFVEEFQGSELQKYLTPTHVELEMATSDESDTVESYSCDGIEVIELSKLRHLAHKIGTDAFSEYLASLVERLDLVLWDLPSLSKIDREREFYLPMVGNIHSLGLVIDSGKSRHSDIKSIHAFSKKYQMKVEGAIFYKQKR